MAQHFDLTVPTILETQITGWMGTGAKLHRAARWEARIESGKPAALSRNGEAIAWADAPDHARRFANEVVAFFNAAQAMEGKSN